MEGTVVEEELREEFGIVESNIDEIECSLGHENVGESEEDFLAVESSYDYDDLFNFEVSVAIAETETDEMTTEFSDAVNEIDGKKSFPCTLCEKVCKSKGGLTRHTNSKHSEGPSGRSYATLCEDDVAKIIKAIKDKIIEEKLYGAEIISGLDGVVSTEAFFSALLPIYQTFCRKTNQDKLLESFYGLIPRSCELLSCQDYRIANLVMIHVPEHLIKFSQSNQTMVESLPKDQAHLDPAEYGPLTYVRGYVIAKLYQLSRTQKAENSQELQRLLQSIKTSEPNNYISAQTRGGLVTPSRDLVNILEITEICFRKHIDQNETALRNIPIETIVDLTLSSPIVKSLWDNIVSEAQPSSCTQKLCLENILKLYIRVRSFSYARDFITKYNNKAKQLKKKALRTDLKRK